MTAIVPTPVPGIIRLERTPIPRRVVQMQPWGDALVALADDGTLWHLQNWWSSWADITPLPPREEE